MVGCGFPIGVGNDRGRVGKTIADFGFRIAKLKGRFSHVHLCINKSAIPNSKSAIVFCHSQLDWESRLRGVLEPEQMKALKSMVGRGFPIGVGNDRREIVGNDSGNESTEGGCVARQFIWRLIIIEGR